ncbi:hypothetical protein Q0M94_14285 [Deinococcus radiomollis]|uniref:hypothetical protein n=1 Tax=Deinococcus radiomollis TaxID=468916 RepID=UPI003891868B
MTQAHTKYSVLHPVHPAQSAQTVSADTVQPAVFFEVILNAGTPLPLPGWTLRLWPQARLGDATLEAIPEDRTRTQAELLTGLSAQGIEVLGPFRRHV